MPRSRCYIPESNSTSSDCLVYHASPSSESLLALFQRSLLPLRETEEDPVVLYACSALCLVSGPQPDPAVAERLSSFMKVRWCSMTMPHSLRLTACR